MKQAKQTRLVASDEVARHFGVTIGTVNRWVRDAVIPCIRPTRRIVRFDLEAVERAVAKASQRVAR